MRWLRCFQHGLAALGMLYLVVTISPLVGWWARLLAGPWNDPRGETLIVLGNEVQRDGIIGESSYWRCVYAVRTWREGGFRRVVVTGGGQRPISIAKAMQEFLVSQGVPAGSILVEESSRSTRENALFTRRLLGDSPERKVLLTSDYHTFRAGRTFRKAGLAVLPRPFPDALKRAKGWENRWTVFLGLVGETVKIGYYWARGWI